MAHFLFVIGVVGLITSSVYAALVVLGVVRFARRRRRCSPASFHPPVSLLKPLHGSEPGLEAHLESFFCQDYPQFEILFCARHDADPGLAMARRVAVRYPNVPAKFLISGEPVYPNAKVWSLEAMQAVAQHNIMVVSDSDVSVTPEYLRAVVAPFEDERTGLVTCLYRGAPEKSNPDGGSMWSRLEAVGMSVEMSSGVLVAEMLEGMKFALGPTMVVRRDYLERAGGFRVLGRYHADDFILGNLIAAAGHKVVLSTHVITHHILNSAFAPSAAHQIRWMKSTRFSRPKGHLGTALTFSMPYALLASATLAWHRPWLAALFLLWGLATRVGLAWLIGSVVVEEQDLARAALLYPIRDLLGFFYWAVSYVGAEVQWRGKVYQLLRNGLMHSEADPGEHEPDDREPEAVLTA